MTATSLVTFALLGVRDRALTLEQVRAVIAPLLDYLDAREIPGPAADLRDPAAVRRDAGDARRGRRRERLRRRAPSRCGRSRPAATTSPPSTATACCTTFVNRAIVELVVLDLAEHRRGDAADAAWEEALRCRDLLKFEFFFARKDGATASRCEPS